MKNVIDLAIGCFVLVAALAVIGGLGPGLDQYDSLKAAQQEEAKAQRLAAALRDLCGENGVAVELASGEYRCYTKLGHPTSKVAALGGRP